MSSTHAAATSGSSNTWFATAYDRLTELFASVERAVTYCAETDRILASGKR